MEFLLGMPVFFHLVHDGLRLLNITLLSMLLGIVDKEVNGVLHKELHLADGTTTLVSVEDEKDLLFS